MQYSSTSWIAFSLGFGTSEESPPPILFELAEGIVTMLERKLALSAVTSAFIGQPMQSCYE